jgi:hypothetical protein
MYNDEKVLGTAIATLYNASQNCQRKQNQKAVLNKDEFEIIVSSCIKIIKTLYQNEE